MQRKTGARKDGTKVSEMHRVDQYPVASRFINQMMAKVIERVRNDPILKRKLFQANFQDTLSGEAMVSVSSSDTAQLIPSISKLDHDTLAWPEKKELKLVSRHHRDQLELYCDAR